jgi:hypothetical protein
MSARLTNPVAALKPMEDMGIPPAAYVLLRENGIHSTEQLVKKTEMDLLRIGINSRTISWIKFHTAFTSPQNTQNTRGAGGAAS